MVTAAGKLNAATATKAYLRPDLPFHKLAGGWVFDGDVEDHIRLPAARHGTKADRSDQAKEI